MKLQRRHFLKLVSVAGTTCLVKPTVLLADNRPQEDAANIGAFPVDPVLKLFSQRQREVLTVLFETALPGSGELGAARFTEQILSAFEFTPPRIFHDGTDFIPLNRHQERAWRLRIFGSSGAGGSVNDGVLGPVVGLREEVQAVFDQTEKVLQGNEYPFTPQLLVAAWSSLSTGLQQRLVEIAVQSTVGHPAYGGNENRGGWKLIFFEGDSLPAGYSQYDAASGKNIERADAPLSGPNPGADPMPVSWITATHLRLKNPAGTNAGKKSRGSSNGSF